MDELMQAILTQLNENSGSVTYPAILEATPYPKRGILPRALTALKKTNQVHQTVQLVDGKAVHTYHIGAKPDAN